MASISSYNFAGLISKVSQQVATQIAKIAVVNNPTLIWSPRQQEPMRVSAHTLYFRKLETATFLSLHVWVYLHSNLCSGLQKTYLFCTRQQQSEQTAFWPFKVIQGRWFWYQSKARMRLVRNSNFGPILHRFHVMTGFMCYLPHPYSTLILGCSRCTRSPMLGVSQSRGLKLFGREIIFEEFQPMWARYLNVPDRRTDRRTTCNLITALCAGIAR